MTKVITYAAGCGAFVKVGRCVNLERRIASLQTGNPLVIEVLGWVDEDIEHSTHRLLAQHSVPRVRGEWFQDSPRLRELLWARGLIWNQPEVG